MVEECNTTLTRVVTTSYKVTAAVRRCTSRAHSTCAGLQLSLRVPHRTMGRRKGRRRTPLEMTVEGSMMGLLIHCIHSFIRLFLW